MNCILAEKEVIYGHGNNENITLCSEKFREFLAVVKLRVKSSEKRSKGQWLSDCHMQNKNLRNDP